VWLSSTDRPLLRLRVDFRLPPIRATSLLDKYLRICALLVGSVLIGLELHVACERHDVSILFEGSGGGALVCSRDSPRTSILQLDERPDGSS
jgi:hypothetical protein